MNNYFNLPTIDYGTFMSGMANISQEEINRVVKQARDLGISEEKIKEGLKILDDVKKSKNN